MSAPGIRPGGITLLQFVSAWVAVLVTAGACRADSMPDENPQKARFILNFARFVEWPSNTFESAASPFTIVLLGEVPFAADLEKLLAGKTVGGRKAVVRRANEPEEIEPCQLLYLDPSEDARLDAIFARVRACPILTVGKSTEFVNHRGCIQLYCDQDKVAFRLNLVAAEDLGLKVSSKLLRIAKLMYLPPKPASKPKPNHDTVPRHTD